MVQYNYAPLKELPGTIRLFSLLPSDDDSAPIHGELVEYSLARKRKTTHSYEALSYVWGSTEDQNSILIGEDHFAITQNLHAALLQLRDSTFPRTFWIDAICIDQANNQEKSGQIQLMAQIYALAKVAVVWLGEAADDSEKALEVIQAAGQSAADPVPQKAYQLSINALLRRLWFRRIWVLQEVSAARDILISCGNAQISGQAFCLGINALKDILIDEESLGRDEKSHDDDDASLDSDYDRREGNDESLESNDKSLDNDCESYKSDDRSLQSNDKSLVSDDKSLVSDDKSLASDDKSLHNAEGGVDDYNSSIISDVAGASLIDESLHGRIDAATFLIQGAIFRPRFEQNSIERTSLNICSLGELIDRYRFHEATRHHDKIYALLGMSSDNLEDSGLLPNYETSWIVLFQRFLELLFGKQVLVSSAEREP